MKTRVQMWGNSLALGIPKTFAVEMGLRPGSEVEVSVVYGQLVVSTSEPTYSLDELVAGITDENLHSASDTFSSP